MNKLDRFYNLPTAAEACPLNRRIYSAAKAPFHYLFQFLIWVATPWWEALPVGALAGLIIAGLANFDDKQFLLSTFITDAFILGTEATLALGALVAGFKLLNGLFR